MKKSTFFICALLLIAGMVSAQEDQKFYDCNFNQISGSGTIRQEINKSIDKMQFTFEYEKEIVKEFNVSFTYDESDGNLAMIYFKPFTNTTLFAMASNLDELKKQIHFYSPDEFLNSWEFESMLDKSIENIKKDGTVLTLAYFLVNMPMKPDGKTTTNLAGGKVIRLDYNKYNISLFFKDEVLISYHKS